MVLLHRRFLNNGRASRTDDMMPNKMGIRIGMSDGTVREMTIGSNTFSLARQSVKSRKMATARQMKTVLTMLLCAVVLRSINTSSNSRSADSASAKTHWFNHMPMSVDAFVIQHTPITYTPQHRRHLHRSQHQSYSYPQLLPLQQRFSNSHLHSHHPFIPKERQGQRRRWLGQVQAQWQSQWQLQSQLNSMPPRTAFEGKPSAPGWKRGQLEKLTDWAVNDEANRPIICEYEPSGWWLWTKWRGTVLSMIYPSVFLNLGFSVLVDQVVHHLSESTWPLSAIPPAQDPLIQQLSGANSLWEYQLTLSTFILTFFTSQSYSHWRTVYLTARSIQGRINDVCILLTMGAQRVPDTTRGNGTTYSPEAEDLVKTCTRLIRLSHTFFWAATPTLSNGVGDGGAKDDSLPRADGNANLRYSATDLDDDDNAIGPVLLSVEGLKGLARAGQLTDDEVQALLSSGLPPSQYAYVLLEWVGLHALEGLESGIIRGTAGLEENLFRQITALRAEYFNIGDFAAGRMPLAYVQLVQVLVDSLVVFAPVALYPDLGTLSIPLTALLTLFYKGLLELSKSFLDPFGNEGYPGQNIRVDVLVSELNFGAASRWVTAGEHVPPPPPIPTNRRSKSSGRRSSGSNMSSLPRTDYIQGGMRSYDDYNESGYNYSFAGDRAPNTSRDGLQSLSRER